MLNIFYKWIKEKFNVLCQFCVEYREIQIIFKLNTSWKGDTLDKYVESMQVYTKNKLKKKQIERNSITVKSHKR